MRYGDPTILDHLIDIENDTYHPTMNSMIDEEDYTSFDEYTSMTRTIYIMIVYGPNYVCDVYHNEQVNCLGFDLNSTDNSYCLSFQHMIDIPALVTSKNIDHIKHILPGAFATSCIAFLFFKVFVLSHVSLLPENFARLTVAATEFTTKVCWL